MDNVRTGTQWFANACLKCGNDMYRVMDLIKGFYEYRCWRCTFTDRNTYALRLPQAVCEVLTEIRLTTNEPKTARTGNARKF